MSNVGVSKVVQLLTVPLSFIEGVVPSALVETRLVSGLAQKCLVTWDLKGDSTRV